MERGWQAQLELDFVKSGNRTVIARRRHLGPLTVQRPFYPEGDVCHVYLLHPPGGVVGGDTLNFIIHANEESHAFLTTPAAGKFYRSEGQVARQHVTLSIDHHATLEWLPQETIIYDGATCQSTVNISLATPQARFIGWEILSLGRPASGEGFDCGFAHMNWQMYCQERPLFLERLQLDKHVFLARWGLQGHSAYGTLFATPTTQQCLIAVRDLIGDAHGRSVTQMDTLLICRAMDHRCDKLRYFFEQVWQIVRDDMLARRACPPRIWAT
jgi:urease accessory protein